MKKFLLMVLLISTVAELCAQTNDLNCKACKSFTRSFTFQLDTGEKMILHVTDISDLDKMDILDSIIRLFKYETAEITDTLSQARFARRVDYVAGIDGIKNVKVTSYPVRDDNYVLKGKDISFLKYEQDTVTITGFVPGYENAVKGKEHYYRLTFHLNDLNNIDVYANGQITEKIRMLRNNVNTPWHPKGTNVYMKMDPRITAGAARGHLGARDFIILRFSIDVQNYKNAFVPSTTVGFSFQRNTGRKIYDFGVSSELHFRFATVNDELKRYMNPFITLSYGNKLAKYDKVESPTSLLTFISLGYLVKSHDPYYDKHTFKLGLGRLVLSGSTLIEPTLYFNDLLKNVTPSFRVVQRF